PSPFSLLSILSLHDALPISYALCPTMYLFDLYTQYDSRFKGTFMINFYDRYYDFYDKNDELNELNIQYYYAPRWALNDTTSWRQDRKSTRLNSSHVSISYAV